MGVIFLNIFNSVIKSVLTALYQYFWVSLLFAFAGMTCYMFIYENNKSGQGLKKTIRLWFSSFKESFDFRLLFFLMFYIALILFRTLLNRELYINPLNDIMGGWQLFVPNAAGNNIENTNGIENIILFVPFSFLLLWFLNTRKDRKSFGWSFFISIAASFAFSSVIEFSQLIFRLGTIQIADLVYNTAGGITGSLIYFAGRKIACKVRRH